MMGPLFFPKIIPTLPSQYSLFLHFPGKQLPLPDLCEQQLALSFFTNRDLPLSASNHITKQFCVTDYYQ